jgi:hypothetical protein
VYEPEIIAIVPEPEPQPAYEPEPEPEPEPEILAVVPEPEIETVVAAYKAAEPEAPTPSAFDLANFMELFRNGKLPFGKNPIVDIGASVAAVAVPMLAYLLMEFMKNKSPKNGNDKPS